MSRRTPIIFGVVCAMLIGCSGCAAIAKNVLTDPEIKGTLTDMTRAAVDEAVGPGTTIGEITAYILAILTAGGVGSTAVHKMQKRDRRAYHGNQK